MNYQEQEAIISDLEIQIDRLRALYEQYFMGIEKLEPHIPRKQVERTFRLLRKQRINNTALRFRFMMLVQRYSTMENYWRRVVRQIEEGTYRRLVMRTRREIEVPPPDEGDSKEKKRKKKLPTHDVDLDEFEDTNPRMEFPYEIIGEEQISSSNLSEDTQPSIAELLSDPQLGSPAAARTPQRSANVPARVGAAASRGHQVDAKPMARGQAGLTEGRINDIYRDYVSARQRCNQNTHGLTIEKVTQQIRKQENTLRKKHGKDVDFEVVVKDGRAILKAIKKG